MNARLLAVLPLLLFGACATSAPTATETPMATTLVRARLGETVAAGGLRFTPLSVAEDSRCPADANCIQAGTLRLLVRIETGQTTVDRAELTVGRESWWGRRIELVAGCPYPLASQPTPVSQQRFVIAVGDRDDLPESPPDYCA